MLRALRKQGAEGRSNLSPPLASNKPPGRPERVAGTATPAQAPRLHAQTAEPRRPLSLARVELTHAQRQQLIEAVEFELSVAAFQGRPSHITLAATYGRGALQFTATRTPLP